jgi:hypothetical protein
MMIIIKFNNINKFKFYFKLKKYQVFKIQEKFKITKI